MTEKEFSEVLSALEELCEDEYTPKNLKQKLNACINIINEDMEKTLKKSKLLHELEELSDEINLQSYTRTRLFNIVSLLEAI